MPVLENLLVKLGYDVDQEKIDAFNESVNTSARTMQKVAIAGIGAASAMAFFTKKMADVANQQIQIAKNLGVPTEVSNAWRDAAEDMGISADTATAALSTIATVQEDLAAGKPPSPEFLRGLSQIGLTIDDIQNAKPGEALLKINKGLQTLEGTAQRGATGLLGLRDQFNLVADPTLGDRVAENLRAPVERANLTELTKEWADFTQDMRETWLTFADTLAPTIISALDVIGEHLNRVIKDFGEFLDDVFNAPAKALKSFRDLTDDTVLGGAQSLATDAFEAGDKLLQSAGDFLSNPFGIGGQGALAQAASAGGGNRTTTTVNNDVKVDVQSNNPDAVAQTIKRAMETENKKAIGNTQSNRAG